MHNLLRNGLFDNFQNFKRYNIPKAQLVIRKNSKAKIVLRAPNIEHLIWEKTAQSTKNPLKKIYLNQLAYSLKKYELEMVNNFDGVYPVTNVNALRQTRTLTQIESASSQQRNKLLEKCFKVLL
jgi:hypothetical protein